MTLVLGVGHDPKSLGMSQDFWCDWRGFWWLGRVHCPMDFIPRRDAVPVLRGKKFVAEARLNEPV